MHEVPVDTPRRLPRWALPAAGLAVVAVVGTVLLIVRTAGASCPTRGASRYDVLPAAGSAAPVPGGPEAGVPGPRLGAVPAGWPAVGAARSGKATYYAANGGGNCSFEAAGPGMYVALGPSEYAAGAACGGYLDVSGPKGTVRVKVTDQCPECEPGHLDLSKEAFAKIGAVVDGIIPVTYRQVVDPKLAGALTVRIKEGASQYWFAVRIDNHGNPLSTVEVKSGSSWVRLAHTDYNYWLKENGAGSGPFTLRLTDTAGHTVTVAGITLAPQKTQQTSVWMYGGSGGAAGSPTAARSPSPATSAPASSAAPSPAATEAAGASAEAETSTPAATPSRRNSC